MNDAEIQLSDGRSLAYRECGVPDGNPVFIFHGIPGSRQQAVPDEALATALGLRILAPDDGLTAIEIDCDPCTPLTCAASLRVTDPHGATNDDTVIVTVGTSRACTRRQRRLQVAPTSAPAHVGAASGPPISVNPNHPTSSD